MTIGERIKEQRIKKDMSLQDLANLLKISRQTIYKYETGTIANIPLDKITALSEIFGMTEAELTGWDQKYYQKESAKQQLIARINEMTEEECSVLLKFISK